MGRERTGGKKTNTRPGKNLITMEYFYLFFFGGGGYRAYYSMDGGVEKVVG